MFYESVSHTSRPVASAAEAATLIRCGSITSCQALIWQNSRGQRIAAVGDGGLDNPWFEVAVINLDANRQIESITFGWINDLPTAIRYLEECQDATPLGNRPANCPLDGEGESTPTSFTCGCCGTGFMSTIAEQRIHDQDEGYGYCPKCLAEFGSPSVAA